MSGRTVWKITLSLVPEAALGLRYDLPSGARFLACAEQHGEIALFEVDPSAVEATREFCVFGTGTGPIPDGYRYLGTTLHTGGSLVLHIYEVLDGDS